MFAGMWDVDLQNALTFKPLKVLGVSRRWPSFLELIITL